ncbi:DUF262 domain-containing protein [Rhodococcus cercidiphylli]|uniref:DUF262 domain-containing protein n=1 Tax=Rhodococcus cercidiphylli TaxID=489916 RepID=A0ABU4B3H6_9NOCA|nr:DUF262 domain-containing protein [Rhodococcus cercidiphylli]MDV6233029.1 DUF262 domain-containing protein [Rhodococcus cercidiphylli]
MVDSALKFEIESKVVADFRKMSQSKELILRPPYQRKAVWPDLAKVSLMETILLGYPIPEIYLAYETSADGDQSVSVVDGQQRLTALLEFLDNVYPLDGLEDESLKGSFEGKYFRDLPADVRTDFFQYRFPIRRLSNISENFVRSVFARVNRVNMVLTEQEIRNALLPGPFNEFLLDCVAHEVNTLSGVFSGERRKRGGDLEFYAEVFTTCIFGISNKKQELDERYNELSSNFEDYRSRSAEFLAMLTKLTELVKWDGRTRWSNIVDLFTLIEVGWNSREEINQSLPQDEVDKFREVMDLFQRAVSSFRRDLNQSSGSAESDDLVEAISLMLSMDREAVLRNITDYLSGVRNSSDLGSRRARSQALSAITKAVLT